VTVKLSCETPLELFDQPLTLEIALADSWAKERVIIRNANREEMKYQTDATSGTRLRFDVSPADAEFAIERLPSN
jgi:hypothetical protein